MKKEQSQKNKRRKIDIFGDNVIRQTNQDQVPFLCIPVKAPYEKSKPADFFKRNLYRVIKLK